MNVLGLFGTASLSWPFGPSLNEQAKVLALLYPFNCFLFLLAWLSLCVRLVRRRRRHHSGRPRDLARDVLLRRRQRLDPLLEEVEKRRQASHRRRHQLQVAAQQVQVSHRPVCKIILFCKLSINNLLLFCFVLRF